MRAEVKIPKGWRKVRTRAKLRPGDMWLVLGGVTGVEWVAIGTHPWADVQASWQPVIRRVKGGKP